MTCLRKQIRVDVIGKTHIGKVIDVDNDGVLILKDDQGRLQRIFSGDVTLARQISARSLKKGG
jgi:biotin-(acetyl-CoA carboxylase) ligase